MLAMIIPGGVIVACLMSFCDISIMPDKNALYCCYNCCNCDSCNNDWSIINVTLFIVASYIVGLVNNWICDGIFRGFRNNPIAIIWALDDVISLHGNKGLNGYGGSVCKRFKIKNGCLVLLCFYIAVACAKTSIATIKKALCCYKKVGKSNCYNRTDRIKGFVRHYYKAYYDLLKDNYLGPIPAIEGQVALLRNLTIPTAILGVCLDCECIIKFMLIVLSLLLYVVMVQRQQKVYKIVWESINYYYQ